MKFDIARAAGLLAWLKLLGDASRFNFCPNHNWKDDWFGRRLGEEEEEEEENDIQEEDEK